MLTTCTPGQVIAYGACSLVIEECCRCHCLFAMPEDLRRRAKADSQVSFWCPNGHSQIYRKSEVQELREKLADVKMCLQRTEARNTHLRDQYVASERSKRAVRGYLTRTRKRIAAGLCPCCKRRFENLERHMSTEHPQWGMDEDE